MAKGDSKDKIHTRFLNGWQSNFCQRVLSLLPAVEEASFFMGIKQKYKQKLQEFKKKALYKNVRFYYCPRCQSEQKFYPITNRTSWGCGKCRKQISPRVGTIFQKSTTPIHKWGTAYEMLQLDEFTQATDIKRAINVSYKCAWRMRKLILSELYPNHISRGMGFPDFSPRKFYGNQYVSHKQVLSSNPPQSITKKEEKKIQEI